MAKAEGRRRVRGPRLPGGTREAMRRLQRFVDERLGRYATERNEPTPYMTTELSAHLHFGHISPLTIALEAYGERRPRGKRSTRCSRS